MLSSISNQAPDNARRDAKISEAIMKELAADVPRDQRPVYLQDLNGLHEEALDEVTIQQVDQAIGELKAILRQQVNKRLSIGDHRTDFLEDEGLHSFYDTPEVKRHLIKNYLAKEKGIIGDALLVKQVEIALEENEPLDDQTLAGISARIAKRAKGLEPSDQEVISECISIYCLYNGEGTEI